MIIALALGFKSRREMKRHLDIIDYLEWKWLMRKHPYGIVADDLRGARQLQATCAAGGGKTTLEECMLAPQPEKTQEEKEALQRRKAFAQKLFAQKTKR